MKISWGTGIVGVIGIFFTVMGIMITIAMNNSTDLVTDDYYEKELQYQDRITSLQNTAGIRDCIRIIQTGDTLVVRIAAEAGSADLTGSVLFYNPADKKKDLSVPMTLDSRYEQRIVTAAFPKGLWKVQASWRSRGVDYFSEQPVILN